MPCMPFECGEKQILGIGTFEKTYPKRRASKNHAIWRRNFIKSSHGDLIGDKNDEFNNHPN